MDPWFFASAFFFMLNVAIVKVQQKQRAKIFAFLKKKLFFAVLLLALNRI